VNRDEIQALRKELQCTARELADTLGLDVATIRAWEQEEKFPTKKWVTAMGRLREQGTAAIRRRPHKSHGPRGLAALRDPLFWDLVAKLAEHPELRRRVADLAADYELPDDG
jgi:DNA-binding XRE family transcriptional regulator